MDFVVVRYVCVFYLYFSEVMLDKDFKAPKDFRCFCLLFTNCLLLKVCVDSFQKLLQVAEVGKACELTSGLGAKDDERLIKLSTNGLLPNQEKAMPPPPPKFTLSSPGVRSSGQSVHNQSKSESVPGNFSASCFLVFNFNFKFRAFSYEALLSSVAVILLGVYALGFLSPETSGYTYVFRFCIFDENVASLYFC